MMIFYKEMEIVRSSPAMIASHSTLLLEARKLRRIACSMTSPVRALSCNPKLALVFSEAPFTFRVHQPELSDSFSC